MPLSRRSFFKHTAAAGVAVAGGRALFTEGAVSPTGPGPYPPATASYPFHGTHQSGILRPGPAEKQAASCFASFDATASGPSALVDLMRGITDRGRFLVLGGPVAQRPLREIPADSDVLGPVVPPDGLTLTVSVGASLFDERYGLSARRPKSLTTMAVFPNDFPDPAWLHGDLLLQLCAHHPDTVHHALRDIMKHTRGGMQLRWRIEGYASPPRPTGTPRNLLGFKDGTANPVGSLAERLVWVDDDAEPAWARGGSYQVVRLIRMLVEFWDRVSLGEQVNIIGREKSTGAPLGMTSESDRPDYAADPTGLLTPLSAHIRLANPRTAATEDQRIVRRSYNYDLGVDENANMQAGHIFTCFQQDIRRQFETIQHRLVNEPMVDYVQPFGGGYFFVLPGVVDAHDWYARSLLS